MQEVNLPDIQKQDHPVVQQHLYPVVRNRTRTTRQSALGPLTERSVAADDGQPEQGGIFLFDGSVVVLVSGLLP